MRVKKEVLAHGAKGGFTNATDLADYLAKKGVPFRDAHELVGRIVLYCSKKNQGLEDLTLEEYQTLSPVFSADLFEAIGIEYCVRNRQVTGGPAPETVLKAIEFSQQELEQLLW